MVKAFDSGANSPQFNSQLTSNLHCWSLHFLHLTMGQVQWLTKTSKSVLIRVTPDCTPLDLPLYHCYGQYWDVPGRLLGQIGIKKQIHKQNKLYIVGTSLIPCFLLLNFNALCAMSIKCRFVCNIHTCYVTLRYTLCFDRWTTEMYALTFILLKSIPINHERGIQ